jgi:hypothetical protein
MEIVLLISCVVIAWAVGTTLDTLPNLGHLLVPSHWLLGSFALVLVTWLMRD